MCLKLNLANKTKEALQEGTRKWPIKCAYKLYFVK